MSFKDPHTLTFLESTLDFLSRTERRRRIVQIASAWVAQHKRPDEARRVLKMAEQSFLIDELPALTAADQDLAHAVILLVDAFGLDWATTLFAKETSC